MEMYISLALALGVGGIGALIDHRTSRNIASSHSKKFFLMRGVLLAAGAYVFSLVVGSIVITFLIFGDYILDPAP